MRAHLEEIVGATGDIEGTGALIIHQPEEFVKEEHFGRFFIKLKWLYDHFAQKRAKPHLIAIHQPEEFVKEKHFRQFHSRSFLSNLYF